MLACIPSEHETLNQSWVDVGPPSTTLSQHKPNIGSMPRVGVTYTHLSKCLLPADSWILPYSLISLYVLLIQNSPPPWPIQAAQTI